MNNGPYAALLGAALLLAGCAGNSSNSTAGDGPTGSLKQAGSSTVLPLAEAWAEDLAPRGIQVSVSGGGSGAGASKLCAKEIDLGDLSRRMKDTEKQTCQANGVDPVEWTIAFDGLTVVVNKQNTWVDQLSVEELAKLWAANSTVHTWADLRAGWPAEAIELYGPDSDSGTYEYFVEEVLGKKCGADGKSLCAPRSDYQAAADDFVMVQGVGASKNGLAYFGYAYYQESQDTLKAVPIVAKGASAAVTPSHATIRDGSYKPFSRPLFIYTDGVPADGTVAHAYFDHVYGEGQDVIEDVGYVPLDDATLAAMTAKL